LSHEEQFIQLVHPLHAAHPLHFLQLLHEEQEEQEELLQGPLQDGPHPHVPTRFEVRFFCARLVFRFTIYI